MTQEQKLKKIFNHFGRENQAEKLVEEANELLQAIQKGDEENFEEELADVLVVIGQFMITFDYLEDKLSKTVNEKVERTLKRIEEKYYEKKRDK